MGVGAMGDDETTLESVTVMGGNRTAVALSLTWSAICVFGGALAISRGGHELGPILRLLMFGALGGGFAAWWFDRVVRRKTRVSGQLRVTAGAVEVSGQRVVGRDEITSAYVWPGRDGTAVRLQRRGRAIDLSVGSVSDGRKLLRALGLDATKAASSFSVLARTRAEYRRRMFVAMGSAVPFVGTMVSMIALGRVWSGAVLAVAGSAGLLLYLVMLLQPNSSAELPRTREDPRMLRNAGEVMLPSHRIGDPSGDREDLVPRACEDRLCERELSERDVDLDQREANRGAPLFDPTEPLECRVRFFSRSARLFGPAQ